MAKQRLTSKLKTNAEWQKYYDAHSLLSAQEVLNDPKRSKAAKKMAGELAKEKVQETADLMKIAQEALSAVESMVVASIENMYEAAGIEVPKNSKERFKVAAGKAMKKKKWNKKKAAGLMVAIGKKGKK